MSTGWMASVEIPPEIQPAVKSIQDDSLDMILYIVWLLFEAMMKAMNSWLDLLCFVLCMSVFGCLVWQWRQKFDLGHRASPGYPLFHPVRPLTKKSNKRG